MSFSNELRNFLSRSYMNTNKKREFLLNRTNRIFTHDRIEGTLRSSFHIVETYLKYGHVSVGHYWFLSN